MDKQPVVDLDALLARGGAPRLALLQHCVKSVTIEPLFIFLVQEYTFRPTRDGALALYDVFCAPDAPARVRALHALPPQELGLSSAIVRLRRESEDLRSADAETISTLRLTTPHRNLFDGVVTALRGEEEGPLATLARRYDPSLSPVENLPGGKLTAGQRQFVDVVWKPIARPRLVAAGFWQIGTIE